MSKKTDMRIEIWLKIDIFIIFILILDFLSLLTSVVQCLSLLTQVFNLSTKFSLLLEVNLSLTSDPFIGKRAWFRIFNCYSYLSTICDDVLVVRILENIHREV